jgi:hypothetical protein
VTHDRRAAHRVYFRGGVLPPSARIHPGRIVIVVDLSTQGALVEGVWRLRPGSRVDLQLEIVPQATTVRGRIERCYVACLSDPAGVRYRAAIRFERAVDFTPPEDLLEGYPVPRTEPVAVGIFGHPLPAAPVGRPGRQGGSRKRA